MALVTNPTGPGGVMISDHTACQTRSSEWGPQSLRWIRGAAGKQVPSSTWHLGRVPGKMSFNVPPPGDSDACRSWKTTAWYTNTSWRYSKGKSHQNGVVHRRTLITAKVIEPDYKTMHLKHSTGNIATHFFKSCLFYMVSENWNKTRLLSLRYHLLHAKKYARHFRCAFILKMIMIHEHGPWIYRTTFYHFVWCSQF